MPYFICKLTLNSPLCNVNTAKQTNMTKKTNLEILIIDKAYKQAWYLHYDDHDPKIIQQ